MNEVRSNQPNAAKLISSLRNTGYNSYAAVEDIIDNSIDAQARIIKILVAQEDKELHITIADNGMGMSEPILDEALKLGSITERDEISDLGKFGMGLCTASISMSKKLEVITKQKNGICLYSCQDLNEIESKNEFIKILRPANKSEQNTLSNLSGECGTVIILSAIDRVSDSNISQFAAKLSRDIGRIYRKFIEADIEFYVNGKRIEANDPLMVNNAETKIYSDEEYELPASAINGKKEKVRVKIAILPEVNKELEKEMRMNIPNQGFYVLRNNREVASGVALDLFQKHNDFNRLRGEISFSATLDNEMGVRFSKDGISPNQAITDFLKQEIGGQITSIRRFIVKDKKADPSSVVDHAGSEQVIAQRAKLLITPEAVIEKRKERTNKDLPHQEESDTNKERHPRITKTSPKGIGARFETASMGREGTLYECYQEGKIIVIRWNNDHPFYDRVVFANKNSKDIVSALDYLVFALAAAELKTINEESIEIMADLKSIMSTNLRALLS